MLLASNPSFHSRFCLTIMKKTPEQKAIRWESCCAVGLMYSLHTEPVNLHMAKIFPSINPCSISREACLSLGNVANYIDILHCCPIIPMLSQFCLMTMLLYSTVDASHVRLAWCYTELIQMAVAHSSCLITVARAVCRQRTKHSSLCESPLVRESISLQSAEYIRPVISLLHSLQIGTIQLMFVVSPNDCCCLNMIHKNYKQSW